MENSKISGYPLCWPERRPRTPAYGRHRAKFKTSFAKARDELLMEIKRLGGSEAIISSNIPRRNDGLPYADAKPKNNDPGIAVYFTRKGKQLCFACDCWESIDDNMHAIALTVQALRGISRWGTGDMMERAFTGFNALPENAGGGWWEVLGIPVNSTIEQAKDAYRELVKKHHPDVGGDSEKFHQVQEAWKQCEGQLR